MAKTIKESNNYIVIDDEGTSGLLVFPKTSVYSETSISFEIRVEPRSEVFEIQFSRASDWKTDEGGATAFTTETLREFLQTNTWGKVRDLVDPNLFITTWRTTTDNETITIPTAESGYNYTVKTSDGQEITNITGDATITFTTAGDYDVSISGAFPAIKFNDGGDKSKLIDIKQWGNIAWTSFSSAFRGCSNLVGTYTDAPDLSGVDTLNNAFRDCDVFTGKVSNWDVSNVTTMSSVFRDASLFNSDLTGWDVSSVDRLNSTFQGASSFNQPIGSWDVGNVTTFQLTFSTGSFDQDLSSWNIVKGTTFSSFRSSVNSFSTANYDAILIGWVTTLDAYVAAGNTYSLTPTANFGISEYTSGGAAEAARSKLAATYGWGVTDGGPA